MQNSPVTWAGAQVEPFWPKRIHGKRSRARANWGATVAKPKSPISACYSKALVQSQLRAQRGSLKKQPFLQCLLHRSSEAKASGTSLKKQHPPKEIPIKNHISSRRKWTTSTLSTKVRREQKEPKENKVSYSCLVYYKKVHVKRETVTVCLPPSFCAVGNETLHHPYNSATNIISVSMSIRPLCW